MSYTLEGTLLLFCANRLDEFDGLVALHTINDRFSW